MKKYIENHRDNLTVGVISLTLILLGELLYYL